MQRGRNVGPRLAPLQRVSAEESAPREFSQSRFAHDFSRVPVHLQRTPDDDPKPATKAPKPPAKPPKPPKRTDVVILGEGWEGGEELSRVLAGGGQVIRVTSVQDAAAALAKITVPIGTLYFVTHSTATGKLKFGTAESYVEAKDIASKFQSSVSAANAPVTVDFRGCSVGTSPGAMDQIRTALGAQKILAGNCYAVIQRSLSVKIGGKPVTKEAEVKKSNPPFSTLLTRSKARFGASGKCIVNPTRAGYFAAGGHFISLWFNPMFSGDWDPDKSVCYKDATRQVVDPKQVPSATAGCQVIEVDAAKTPSP